jgi:hypothetical protein
MAAVVFIMHVSNTGDATSQASLQTHNLHIQASTKDEEASDSRCEVVHAPGVRFHLRCYLFEPREFVHV